MTEVYEGIMERVLALAKSFGRQQPEADLDRRAAKLLATPVAHLSTLLANTEAYRNPQLAEWLIEESSSQRFEDPVLAVRLARLALQVAESLPLGGHRPLVTDLTARAMAYLGNAYRVVNDFQEAQSWLDHSKIRLVDGSGDPLLAAEVARACGRLASETGDFARAYRLYRGAYRAYWDAGEMGHCAEALIDLGRSMVWAGDDQVGRRILIEALRLLENERPDPIVLISAFHSMAYSLAQIGLLDDARYYTALPRPLYARLPGDLARLRCQWMEGTLLEKAGSLEEARQLLEGTREAYSWRGLDYDAALVSLDLSLALVKQRRWTEVEPLARESYAAFAARGLSDRATAALLLFVDAAKQRTLAEELVRRVAGEIRGGQRDAWAAELAAR